MNNFYLIDLTFQVQILHFPRLFLAFIGHQKFKILFRSSNLYKNYTCLHLKVNLNFSFISVYLPLCYSFLDGCKKRTKKDRAFICAKYDKYSHLILHFLLVITHFRNVVYSHYFLLFLARCVQSPSNKALWWESRAIFSWLI